MYNLQFFLYLFYNFVNYKTHVVSLQYLFNSFMQFKTFVDLEFNFLLKKKTCTLNILEEIQNTRKLKKNL